MISDADIELALEALGSEEGPKCRAVHEFKEAMTKTILAGIMERCNGASEVKRERWARVQPEFTDHLKDLARWAQRDYEARAKSAAAAAKIELYRTLSANNRRLDRL